MLTIELKGDTPYRVVQWLTIENLYYKYRGKAYTKWYANGRKMYEEYLVNGKRHRDPALGPAITHWFVNGYKSYEQYLENGRLHRDPSEGPAYTAWHTYGQKYFEEYWVDGKQVNREDYDANY